MRYWLLLLGLPFLLSAEIVWQAEIQKPFAITIKLNSMQIPLDSSLKLEADFHYPSSYQLKIDDLLDHLTWTANPLAPQLRLDQSSVSSIPTEKDLQVQRLQATLRPLTAGPFDISLFIVTFAPKEKSKSEVQVFTPVFNLKALPLPAEAVSLPTAPLMPLEPEFPLGLTETNYQFLRDNPQRREEEKKNIQRILEAHTFPWLTLVALLGCGGVGWAAYLTRERWPKPKPKPIPVISPIQQADKAFNVLQGKHLLQQGLIQDYYAKLASILLTALEAKLGIKTKEMTTFQLVQALKDEANLSPAQKKDILLFLTEIDQVKFAGKKPTSESSVQLFQQIQDFVNQLFT